MGILFSTGRFSFSILFLYVKKRKKNFHVLNLKEEWCYTVSILRNHRGFNSSWMIDCLWEYLIVHYQI